MRIDEVTMVMLRFQSHGDFKALLASAWRGKHEKIK